jgi:superfamily I DNA/RNA helicase
VATIIETLLKKIEYEALLKKEDDYAQRWENVKELINFSTIVAQAGVAVPFTKELGSDEEDEDDGMDCEAEVDNVSWRSAAATTTTDGSQSPTVKSEDDWTRPSKLKRKTYEVIDLASPSEEEEDVKPIVKKSKRGKGRAVKPAANVEVEKKMTQEEATVIDEEEVGDSSIKLGEELPEEEAKTPLRVFLEASTLSTDMEQDDQDGKSPKVTIATTHAAKG